MQIQFIKRIQQFLQVRMSLVTLNADQNLRRYRKMRNQLSLPLRIELYFRILEVSLEQKSSKQSSVQLQGFSNQFYKIFQRFSSAEKSTFLYANLLKIKLQYDAFENSFIPENMSSIRKINTSVQICETLLGINYWTSAKLEFQPHLRSVKVQTKKKALEYDLRFYLIRKSKKHSNTLVFQTESRCQDKKISLLFEANIFDEVYKQLFQCVVQYRNQLLFKSQSTDDGVKANQKQSGINKKQKQMNFIDAKQISQYLSEKPKSQRRIVRALNDFENVYNDKKIKIQRSSSHPEYYRLESIFECSPEVLKQEFKKQYTAQNYTYLIQSQAIQKYSDRYSALYQRHVIQASEGSVVVTEHILMEDRNFSNKTEEQIVFLKSINSVMAKKLIQSVSIKVKAHETQKGKSKLVIYGSFNISQNQKKKITSMSELFENIWGKKQRVSFQKNQLIVKLLLEYSDMLFREEEGEHLSQLLVGMDIGGFGSQKQTNMVPKNSTSFQTVEGVSGIDRREELVLDLEGEQQKCDLMEEDDSNHSTEFEEIQSQKNYLRNSYQLYPKQYGPNEKKELVKDHFIFAEWARRSKGGLLCKDQTPINQQKKVAKFLVKSMGKNILESKGLLNISLPVTIFKPESHLQSVARNFGFAPIVLQKSASSDPVQKMKQALLYSISVSIFSISVSKPFNPVLGQTHQAWIDGCPVYLEQISHHPPIVSYLFIGRGYRAYGKIGPKATFGFNVIYGYSEQPNYVVFDDGTKIEMNFGKMAIKGILFGERQFNFSDKMFAFDSKNKLFSQLTFGQTKKFFSSSNQPEDYLSGRIVEVSDKFVEKMQKGEKDLFPDEKDILKTVSTVDGVWNGKINFDGTEYIDFGTSNPCVMKDQKFPLASDSIYRSDIKALKEGNIQLSQQNKEILEQIQRRDRKLRTESKGMKE